MATHLIVASPFEGHALGDVITDPDTVKRLTDPVRHASVVPVTAPDHAPDVKEG